jgi:hypothetical protein
MLERNVRVLKALCHSVFRCAEKKLITERTCTFCLSRLVTSYYRSQARAAALSCFNTVENSDHPAVSENLKQKMIDSWFETELQARTNTQSATVMQWLVGAIVLLLSVCGVMVMRMPSRGPRKYW